MGSQLRGNPSQSFQIRLGPRIKGHVKTEKNVASELDQRKCPVKSCCSWTSVHAEVLTELKNKLLIDTYPRCSLRPIGRGAYVPVFRNLQLIKKLCDQNAFTVHI